MVQAQYRTGAYGKLWMVTEHKTKHPHIRHTNTSTQWKKSHMDEGTMPIKIEFEFETRTHTNKPYPEHTQYGEWHSVWVCYCHYRVVDFTSQHTRTHNAHTQSNYAPLTLTSSYAHLDNP